MATDSVLTEASTITCGHTPPAPPPPPPTVGKVVIEPPSVHLTVGGKHVLLLTESAKVTVPVRPGCPIVPSPAGNKPCTTVAGLSGGAQRLTADGAPVLLEKTLQGTPDGVPKSVKLSVSAGQTRLKAE